MHQDPTATPSDPRPNQEPPPEPARPEILLDEHAGLIQIRDARLFQADHRGFARRLLESLCARPGVKRAEVALGSSTCLIEFDDDCKSSNLISRCFVEAVKDASIPEPTSAPWARIPRWSTLTAYRTPSGLSIWETHEDHPDRVRLLHQGARDPGASSRLADGVWRVEGVERYYVSPWSRWITIVHGTPDGASVRGTLDHLESLLQGKASSAESATELAPAVIVGWSRLGYLALAGGSLVMTLVGLVVPGIPTVPFLLATSYYLARSSPRLNTRLHRTAFIGEILEEWETHSAFSHASKSKLIGLTLVIVVVTLVVSPLTPIAVLVILIVASLSVGGILRAPSLKPEPSAHGTLALSAG